jgi:autophagy-related protein 9
MKIALFVQEIASVLVTPFVLWYSLPECASAVVDFFREFTVHVDGLGYVCSFGVFDFARHGDTRVCSWAGKKKTRRRAKYFEPFERSCLGRSHSKPCPSTDLLLFFLLL